MKHVLNKISKENTKKARIQERINERKARIEARIKRNIYLPNSKNKIIKSMYNSQTISSSYGLGFLTLLLSKKKILTSNDFYTPGGGCAVSFIRCDPPLINYKQKHSGGRGEGNRSLYINSSYMIFLRSLYMKLCCDNRVYDHDYEFYINIISNRDNFNNYFRFPPNVGSHSNALILRISYLFRFIEKYNLCKLYDTCNIKFINKDIMDKETEAILYFYKVLNRHFPGYIVNIINSYYKPIYYGKLDNTPVGINPGYFIIN